MRGQVRFRLSESPAHSFYDVYVGQNGVVTGPYEGIGWTDENREAGKYEIVLTEPITFGAGQVKFQFTPGGQACVLGEEVQDRVCASSEDHHQGWPYNGGCCTRGCWCQQGGEWGCWTTCDARCAD